MTVVTFRPRATDDDHTAARPVQDAGGYTIFSTGDLGRAHEMAHRMLDEGRIETGHRRLGAWLEGRSGSGSDWVHLQFHMAVFELELGYVDAAHARFVEHVLRAAEATTEALTDAPALAWRLMLAGGQRVRFAWEPMRATAATRIADRDAPYVDLHHALALAGSGDLRNLDRWIASRKRRARTHVDDLVLRVATALWAYAVGDFLVAATCLAAVVPSIPEIGGSRAQNELFVEIERAAWQRVSAVA